MMFQKILGIIGYMACVAVGSRKFGWQGSALCLAAWLSACIYLSGKYAAQGDGEESEQEDGDDDA